MAVSLLLAAAALVPAIAAHDVVHVQHPRQAATTSASISASVPPATGGTVTSAANSTLPTPSVSLLSTNPTAIPLSLITSGITFSAQPTISLPTSYPAGASVTDVPGAPALPDVSKIVPSNYPPLDLTPDVNSPEVQQWIQEVANSGISVPDLTPTVAGGCPSNPQAVADTSRCWWTCGGCTRNTDITTCPDKLTWGVTYDDGPGPWTPNLLQYLDANQIKASFFTIGSRALSRPAMLQEEYMGGHQIGVHTWSHPSLTTKSTPEIIAELGWTKKLIKDILGVTPNTMRPPFGDIDDRVRNISLAMGLTPVIWTRISPMATFDTNDFSVPGGTTTANQVLANWNSILGNATQINTGFIVLEHDLWEQTVDIATGYILPDALAFQPKLSLKPVVSCQGMPLANAYIETNDNSTNPPLATLGVTGNGTGTGTAGGASSTGGTNGSGKSAAVPGVRAGLATVALGVVAGVAAILL